MSEYNETVNCSVIEASFLMRRDMYSFFDIIFRREPNTESFENLANMMPIINAYADNFGNGSFQQDKRILEEYFSKNRKDTVEKLATEFSRIFYGVDRYSAIHPYESVYLSSERIMVQEPCDEVTKFYAEHKLALKKDVKEIEDHLSIELCFMSHIHSMTASAAGADDAVAVVSHAVSGLSFLKQHLGRWSGLLYSDMVSLNICPFYLASCGMVVHLVEEDSTFLAEFAELLQKDIK